MAKPLKLTRNFRSHAGVIEIANQVLDLMSEHFPQAADKLPKDTGLANGPRPGQRLATSFANVIMF
jgi:ATP-dependent exoDNAse (exonuclease V) beta subunit